MNQEDHIKAAEGLLSEAWQGRQPTVGTTDAQRTNLLLTALLHTQLAKLKKAEKQARVISS